MLSRLSGALNGAAYKIAISLGLRQVRAIAAGEKGPQAKAVYWSLAGKKAYFGVVLAALTAVLLALGYPEAAAGLGAGAALLVQAGILDRAWREDRPAWLTESATYRWLAARSTGLASLLSTSLLLLLVPDVCTWIDAHGWTCMQAAMAVTAIGAVLVQLGLIDAAWRAAPPLIPLRPLAPTETLPEYVQRDGPTAPGIPGPTVPRIHPRVPPGAVLVLCLLAAAATAQEPAPTHVVDIEGVRVQAVTAVDLTMGGDTDSAVSPSLRLRVDGPLAFGSGSIGRINVELEIRSGPGETVDLARAGSIRRASLELGASREIGRMRLGAQRVSTSVVAGWAFAAALGESDPAAAQRYVRRWGAGLRFEERTAGAVIELRFGRDEAAGDWGYGQWLVAGQVPLSLSRGVVILGGDAVLSVGRHGTARQRDAIRLYAGLSLPALVDAVR